MINKLMVSFLVIFFIGSLLAFICEGKGGLKATQLEYNVDASSHVLYVSSTSGFDKVGVIYIEDEQIAYRGVTDNAFLSCSRGYNGTVPATHAAGKRIYTSDASALNRAMGFDVVRISSAGGLTAFPLVAGGFVIHTLPKLITFDFSFLQGDGLIYFRYFMMLFGVAFVFAVFYLIFTAIGSVGSTLFSRS